MPYSINDSRLSVLEANGDKVDFSGMNYFFCCSVCCFVSGDTHVARHPNEDNALFCKPRLFRHVLISIFIGSSVNFLP